MGQSSKGALTVYQVRRLSIQELKRSGILNSNRKAKLTFPDGATMGIQHFNDSTGRYIELNYSVTSDGESDVYNCRIYISEVKSNLGNGNVLYFLCPVTYNRCRYLYMAYNYPKFKSRVAYQNRLYYPSQKVKNSITTIPDFGNWKMKLSGSGRKQLKAITGDC